MQLDELRSEGSQLGVQHDVGGDLEPAPILAGKLIANDEVQTAAPSEQVLRVELLEQLQQPVAHRLRVARRVLAEHDEVHGEPSSTPPLVGTDQIPQQAGSLGIPSLDEQDGKVAGEAEPPQPALPEAVLRERHAVRAKRAVWEREQRAEGLDLGQPLGVEAEALDLLAGRGRCVGDHPIDGVEGPVALGGLQHRLPRA